MNPAKRPPTQRQLDAIARNVAEKGYSPTIREIGAAIGVRSTNGISENLRALTRKGLIARNVFLTPAGEEAIQSTSLSPPPSFEIGEQRWVRVWP